MKKYNRNQSKRIKPQNNQNLKVNLREKEMEKVRIVVEVVAEADKRMVTQLQLLQAVKQRVKAEKMMMKVRKKMMMKMRKVSAIEFLFA